MKFRLFCVSILLGAAIAFFMTRASMIAKQTTGKLSTAQAQPMPKDPKEIEASVPVPDPLDGYLPGAPVVNLPPGQKFVGFVPREESLDLANPRRYDLYMTEDRPQGEAPRKLTIYGPGMSPHSWVVHFHIQEH